MDEKGWDAVDMKTMVPRLWLEMENKNFALSWALITQLQASGDFLSISFMCEFGQVRISSAGSLKKLFEYLLWEKVRYIDGRQFTCQLSFAENSLELYTVSATSPQETS